MSTPTIHATPAAPEAVARRPYRRRSGLSPHAVALLAWSLAVLCTLTTAVGMYFQYLDRHTYVPIDFGSRSSIVVSGIVFVVMPLTGALIATRRPGSPLGWLFIAIGATMALYILADGYAVYAVRTKVPAPAGGHVAAWVANWSWVPGWGMTAFVFLLFPDGHLPSRRWLPVSAAAALVTAAVFFGLAFERGFMANYTYIRNPYGFLRIGEDASWVKLRGVGLLALVGVGSIASLFVRMLRSKGDERQQLKWVGYAGGVLVAVVAMWTVLYALGVRSHIGEDLSLFLGIILPIAAGVAVLKYRLYDIDVVINKTVVYGIMVAFLTAVYVGIVVGIGAAVGLRSNADFGLSVVATMVVAFAFQPVKERAQRFANRLVYGKRATPYEVLSEFSERVAGAYSSEEVLPRMARILTEATSATQAEIWLRVGGELRPAASYPSFVIAEHRPVRIFGDDLPGLSGCDLAFPVRHRGELLGAIGICTEPNADLTPSEQKLLRDLSLQAGLVLRNVRLIEELQDSRRRIVSAQDAGRRRLERNIHDGAQQQLVAMAVKLRLAEGMLDRDPERLRTMFTELQADTNDALDTLRDLARGIYPPLLALQGLEAALEAQARKSSIPVQVHADGIRRYRQETEAALYFCCLEALQNAGKYSGASKVDIHLREEGDWLVFRIADDGRGFDPGRTPQGMGLTNMADRVAAQGGTLEVTSTPGAGTTVSGRLPATAPAPT